MIQLQMIQQEAQQLEQQLQAIEQHLSEMSNLKQGLEELDKSDEKEILAGLGKGIYIPAEIKTKKLRVEVGKGNFVNKTIPETLKIVDEQLEKLEQVKTQINGRVSQLQVDMNSLMM